jgi:hypothetical protein
MNSFVLFGDGAITPKKKKDGNFASCATRTVIFFRVILHHQTKKINSFLKSINEIERIQFNSLEN